MNITPITKAPSAPRFTDHYHLMRPQDAVDKYGISIERARQIFRGYGFRFTPRGHLYMHPDTLALVVTKPWELDKNPYAKRGRLW